MGVVVHSVKCHYRGLNVQGNQGPLHFKSFRNSSSFWQLAKCIPNLLNALMLINFHVLYTCFKIVSENID